MQLMNSPVVKTKKEFIQSNFLDRKVEIDFFIPTNVNQNVQPELLLINDGQNLEEMQFERLLESLYAENTITSLVCVGIYAGNERKAEFGVANQPDYLGRGAKAALYTRFVLEELMPFIQNNYSNYAFNKTSIAGFSLGGLMAIDMAWNHPAIFSTVGVFSGSFWWRSIDQNDINYNDDEHRIMQQEIRNAELKQGLKFFFQCGNKDETMDRNNNGIIDSIDDTIAIMDELVKKGYDREKDIFYLEMPDGYHDISTWKKAMPAFLKWGWGVNG
jgi:enterochelin esterase-like enzyme